jgi:hypothetical protein
MKPGMLGGLLLLAYQLIPLAAQPAARIDLDLSNRYVWHGLSRAAGLVLQPSVAAGYRWHRVVLAGGLVRHYELDRVSPGELSELAAGSDHLGEDDAWAQAELELGAVRVRSGVTRYVFRAGPPRNTTELCAAVAVTTRYLNPTLESWWDVGRVRGGFVRASASSPVFGWPTAPFWFVALVGAVGVNLGQAPDPVRPDDPANFASRGPTHAELGLNFVSRLQHWSGVGSASLSIALNSQLNFDAATRYGGAGGRRNFIFWLSTGVTLLLGGEAKLPR